MTELRDEEDWICEVELALEDTEADESFVELATWDCEELEADEAFVELAETEDGICEVELALLESETDDD